VLISDNDSKVAVPQWLLRRFRWKVVSDCLEHILNFALTAFV
jgi:hypothetical protein